MSAANIISLFLILVSALITGLNIAWIYKLTHHSKPKQKVNPEIDKETELKLDQLYKLVRRSAFTIRGLMTIADEISSAAEDYKECISNLLTKRSLSIIDYNQGENACRKVTAVIKKYNLPTKMLTEEEVPNE